MTRITYREAIRSGLRDALAGDDRVFLMGEDVGRYGGAFACSRGLLEEFGPERIRDTPLSESAFVGAGIGANKVKADIAAGRDELVPADVVRRILSGENPIRVWRSHRGMSTRDLATAAGLSAPYISEIETGKKEGSISVLRNIAKALGVDLDDLVWGEDVKRPASE